MSRPVPKMFRVFPPKNKDGTYRKNVDGSLYSEMHDASNAYDLVRHLRWTFSPKGNLTGEVAGNGVVPSIGFSPDGQTDDDNVVTTSTAEDEEDAVDPESELGKLRAKYAAVFGAEPDQRLGKKKLQEKIAEAAEKA